MMQSADFYKILCSFLTSMVPRVLGAAASLDFCKNSWVTPLDVVSFLLPLSLGNLSVLNVFAGKKMKNKT